VSVTFCGSMTLISKKGWTPATGTSKSFIIKKLKRMALRYEAHFQSVKYLLFSKAGPE
jgi:hypothetical protein